MPDPAELPDLTGSTVAIIATDRVEEREIVGPRDLLLDAGAAVVIHSPSGEPVQAVQSDVDPTQQIPVDGTLDNLDVDFIDALMVPGGTVNADNLRTNARAQALVRQIAGAGKPLAVICHGPWLLVSAGLVAGLRLTSWPSLADDIRNAGGDWVDEEVVVDGSVITSRKPDDVPAFVDALGQALVNGG